MSKKRLIWFVILTTIVGSAAFAISQGSSDQRNVLSQLRSDEWKVRSAAVEDLIGSRDALKSDELKNELIDLLERENQLIDSVFRASGGEEGISVKYGEAYSEYYAKLFDAVYAIAADGYEKRAIDTLARGSYNSDSRFAIWLARVDGENIVSTMLDLSRSDIAPKRQNALAVLGRILGEIKDPSITESRVEQIKQVLIESTSDQDVGVRMEAVRSLGTAGDKSSIPLLERIAQSDLATTPTGEGANVSFPVREEARKALNAIRKKQ